MSDQNHMSVMPKKLAQALMEAGVKHFAFGGFGQGTHAGQPQQAAPPIAPAPQQAQGPGAPQQMGGPGVTNNTHAGGGSPYGEAASDFEHGDIGGGIMSGANPANAIGGIGAAVQGLGQAFTAQNNYQANLAPQMQTGYGELIRQGGLGSLAAFSQQQNLANTLLAQSRGQGPNPAQDMLNQSTAKNISNQGALMASQRGASSNPALIARQAAMQGANTQQQAVGQAATLGGQQRLAAQQQLGNTYGQMGAESNTLFGSALAGQNTQNANEIQNYAMAQGINAQVAQSNTNAQNATTGGILGALGGGGASMFADGGMVSGGGGVAQVSTPQIADGKGVVVSGGGGKGGGKDKKKKSDDGEYYPGQGMAYDGTSMAGGAGDAGGLTTEMPMYASSGGEIDGGQVSGGGGVADITGSEIGGGQGAWAQKKDKGGGGGLGSIMGLAAMLAKGGYIPPSPHFSRMLLAGGRVPGKASVQGDSQKNDNQPAMLSPGEIVLPRSVTQSPDMEKKAIEFLRHLKRKGGGYKAVAESRGKKMSCGGKV